MPLVLLLWWPPTYRKHEFENKIIDLCHHNKTYWDHPVGEVSIFWHLHCSQHCQVDVTPKDNDITEEDSCQLKNQSSTCKLISPLIKNKYYLIDPGLHNNNHPCISVRLKQTACDYGPFSNRTLPTPPLCLESQVWVCSLICSSCHIAYITYKCTVFTEQVNQSIPLFILFIILLFWCFVLREQFLFPFLQNSAKSKVRYPSVPLEQVWALAVAQI